MQMAAFFWGTQSVGKELDAFTALGGSAAEQAAKDMENGYDAVARLGSLIRAMKKHAVQMKKLDGFDKHDAKLDIYFEVMIEPTEAILKATITEVQKIEEAEFESIQLPLGATAAGGQEGKLWH
eukprot:8251037-Pyramimonas_sp.AAC.1